MVFININRSSLFDEYAELWLDVVVWIVVVVKLVNVTKPLFANEARLDVIADENKAALGESNKIKLYYILILYNLMFKLIKSM